MATQGKVLGAAHPQRSEYHRRTRSKSSSCGAQDSCCTCSSYLQPRRTAVCSEAPGIFSIASRPRVHFSPPSRLRGRDVLHRNTYLPRAGAFQPTVVRPNLSWMRRRSWQADALPAHGPTLSPRDKHAAEVAEVKERARNAAFWNSTYRKTGSYPLAPFQAGRHIPARRGCSTRTVVHISVGQSLGRGHHRTLSNPSETYRHACRRRSTAPWKPLATGSRPRWKTQSTRRVHHWNDYSALGHTKTTVSPHGGGAQQGILPFIRV